MKGINNKNAGSNNKMFEVQFSKGANLTPDIIGSKFKNQGSKAKFEDLLKRNQNSSALNINSPNLNPNDNIIRPKNKYNIEVNNS
jgi:hypothetical protein